MQAFRAAVLLETVVARDQQVRALACHPGGDFGDRQAAPARQHHAQRLVLHASIQPGIIGLQDVGGRGAADRDGQTALDQLERQLVLGPCQAHRHTFVADQEGPGRQAVDDPFQRLGGGDRQEIRVRAGARAADGQGSGQIAACLGD